MLAWLHGDVSPCVVSEVAGHTRAHAEARGDLHGRRHLYTLRRRNGTGHPGSAVDLQSRHLCLRSGRLAPVCAQEVGKFGALLRAGVEAPQIIIEQSSSRFSMQVARTPMASILPVWELPISRFVGIPDGCMKLEEPKAPRA